MAKEDQTSVDESGANDALYEDPMINKARFKSRRRMAWIALAGIFFLIFYSTERLAPSTFGVYEDIISGAIWAFVAVILTYMGSTSYIASTWYGNIGKKNKSENNKG